MTTREAEAIALRVERDGADGRPIARGTRPWQANTPRYLDALAVVDDPTQGKQALQLLF